MKCRCLFSTPSYTIIRLKTAQVFFSVMWRFVLTDVAVWNVSSGSQGHHTAREVERISSKTAARQQAYIGVTEISMLNLQPLADVSR